MTIITSELTIDGIEYTFRFPVGQIIKLEQAAGKPISQIEHDMAGLATLIRFAIQKDGKYLTTEEFNEFLDNITADEFGECVQAVSSILNSKN